MRPSVILVALAMSAPSAAAGPATVPVERPFAQAPANCPRTTSHYAGKGSMYRGQRVVPRKLAELPPATGYMAVYRTLNGCEVPMTVTEYRTGIEYRTGRRP